jgi:cytochrome oxidase Cu insertion factor (SCO1/SenC/PrrC family)
MRFPTLMMVLVLVCYGTRALAQNPPLGVPPGTDSAHIPNFTIVLADGRHFTKADLNPHKPVMIVYYSPTCEHCQHFAQALASHIDQFKGVQIVMVTFRPLNEVKDFTRIGHLEHTGAYVGSEGLTWVVQHHYNIVNFPFVAVYDKYGKLGGIFRNDPIDLNLLRHGLFGGAAGKVK